MSDATSLTAAEAAGTIPLSAGHLLMLAVDGLNNANWQRTGKKSGQPKPLARRLEEEARRLRSANRPGLTDEQLYELSLADPALASPRAAPK